MLHTAAALTQGCHQGTVQTSLDCMSTGSCEGLHSCHANICTEGHSPGKAAVTSGLSLYMHCCTSEDCMTGCEVKLILQQLH